ncbi:DUF1707 SHOCT-like domain-containing protein [Jiangella rhizosphaerae]|uniref:DUF1707 domain-containing protein n=1 Tax=Jiangella rhizosphaerae TaxID=2293569 RepID=A0A418KJ59_9ACTN|nr:DUF1707 domain-containing protein [Jiangella rhizosphaerae]RIQ14397.1 DUF1707 domain-containing protein [Jiangella rhizosphaerae]
MSAEEPDQRLMRVSHADRDRMVEILRDAAADGRLDTDELEERVERALTARTFADLEPLTEGLPVAAPTPAPVPRPAGADDVVRWQAAGQRFRREGAWTVPEVIELGVIGGSARLDYTLARLPEGGRSTLRLAASGSRVRLIVPPGVGVDLSGVIATGGRIRDHTSRHAAPGTPVTHVIVVTGTTFGGSLRVEVSRAT